MSNCLMPQEKILSIFSSLAKGKPLDEMCPTMQISNILPPISKLQNHIMKFACQGCGVAPIICVDKNQFVGEV